MGRQQRRFVYKALIRSDIDYSCIAYDMAANSTKSRLDVIQSKVLKIYHALSYDRHSNTYR